ncbi:zinc finger HIT domain-containing protein 3, partial [Tremellales sp. Uapishka_1]
MAPKSKAAVQTCEVCLAQPSKYRCPACPLRYCSVSCFKAHKQEGCTILASSNAVAGPSSRAGSPAEASASASAFVIPELPPPTPPLKPLSALSWPPEPDPSIFTDPLQKEDAKPLRHSELMRIATSPQLRHLLTTTSLPTILRILDSISSPTSRSTVLSKLLSIDAESLSKPLALTSSRDSPPPIYALLSGDTEAYRPATESGGWWLISPASGGQERIWIGEEERRVM